jgi:thioredoxin-dependent adenylylsulfate APS reductase
VKPDLSAEYMGDGNASVRMNEPQAERVASEFESKSPQDLLAWAIEHFGRGLGVCSSFQAEGSVLIDMAWRIDPNVRVFTVDTGRMPQETYELIDKFRDLYRIKVETFLPDREVLERMVTKHGNNLFYRDVNLRLLCCDLRKVIPLRRALRNYDAWVTGLRRGQWASRSNIRKFEVDQYHGGIAKLAPLADWSERQVWDYIRANNVPYNSLYDKGYKSIGCAPCTRAVSDGHDPRSGRWWWETNGPKECGMHCAIETGGFEEKLNALLKNHNGAGAPADRDGSDPSLA